MKKKEIFFKLFSVLSQDNVEELWLDLIKQYHMDGGDLTILDPSNEWAMLHYAAENSLISVVGWLLDNGVDVDQRAGNGSTPYLIALDSAIDCAVQSGEAEIDFSTVQYLIDNDADIDAFSGDGISKASLLESYGVIAREAYFQNVRETK